MLFDPLHCLGAMFFAGITRSTDDELQPIWKRAMAGTMTAVVVAGVSGIASGYVSGQIVLHEHAIKLDQLRERAIEDRAEVKQEMKELRLILREVDKKK